MPLASRSALRTKPYLDHGSQCPFCQQEVEFDFAARLNAYFDETYLNDMAAVAATLEPL
ncbi:MULTISPECIES: hypothetical protein [unclassified Bradyrhizobium]|uniref:hypothetical protein n=1 Tax=unclassified Bradyrhizobium TaxID=2631580 RepID=UPI0020B2DBDC|nr:MULTISPECIES: hypothetical protein [unclassified Bradyrhizobium]MCP3402876.1 hypothetical protein [Bradyrhizobium sp. CCGB20]MCP3411354.1 hypothetical protein [Bradyrhizobium sp. CCGB01]